MKRMMALACLLIMGAAYPSHTIAQQVGEVKVISYNIRYGSADDGKNSWDNRKEATLQLFNTEKPDLVGMQEVLAGQYDYIKENMPGYGIIGTGRDDGERGGEMMAVMYLKERFILVEMGNFWLSETPHQVSRGWDGACNRMVTWIQLKEIKSGRMLYLFNTHLDHRGEVARLEGAKLLVARMKEIAGNNPLFLTGDFNAPPSDPVLAPIAKKYNDARTKAPVTDNKGTFNGFGSAPNNMVIDHIYYNKATPLTFETLDKNYGTQYISDHYPVSATFKVK